MLIDISKSHRSGVKLMCKYFEKRRRQQTKFWSSRLIINGGIALITQPALTVTVVHRNSCQQYFHSYLLSPIISTGETTPITLLSENLKKKGAHIPHLKSHNETVLGVRCQGQYMQAKNMCCCCAESMPMHEACFGWLNGFVSCVWTDMLCETTQQISLVVTQ